MASETTAAATGEVGVVRRDPMAMLPFCGYNMADYWAHWLEIGRRASHPPGIFQVNWFLRDEENRFVWPGFGQNMRVLQWIRDQVKDTQDGRSRETPIGIMPTAEAIGARDLGISDHQVETLLRVDRDEWSREAEDQEAFLKQFGDRLPPEIGEELQALKQRLR